MVVFSAVLSRIMMSHVGPMAWGAVIDYQCLPWKVWGLRNLMTHMLWIYRPCYRIKAKLLNEAYKALMIWPLTNLLASPLASPCSSYTKLYIVRRTTVFLLTSMPLFILFSQLAMLSPFHWLFLHIKTQLSFCPLLSRFERFFLCVSTTPCAYCNQCFNLIIL